MGALCLLGGCAFECGGLVLDLHPNQQPAPAGSGQVEVACSRPPPSMEGSGVLPLLGVLDACCGASPGWYHLREIHT